MRWLDIAGFGADIAGDLVTRWRAGVENTSALVGMGPDAGFVVDIARDGPHALIAGTTGSGKSELLQTLVASLACANRPDELTFVLIDYKGGRRLRRVRCIAAHGRRGNRSRRPGWSSARSPPCERS